MGYHVCSLITQSLMHAASASASVITSKPIDGKQKRGEKRERETQRERERRSCINQSRLDPRISLNASLANQRHTSCTSLPTRQLPKTTPCCSRTSFARSHRRRQSSSRRLGRGAGGAPADSLTLLLLVRAVEGLDVDVAGRRTLPGVGGHRRSEAN